MWPRRLLGPSISAVPLPTQWVWAWANWDGDPATLRASVNIAGITDNGVGDWTLTFTTSFADANWAGGGLGQRLGGVAYLAIHGTGGQTASSVRIYSNVDGDTETFLAVGGV